MPFGTWTKLILLVLLAGLATVLGVQALARLSLVQQTMLVDGAKVVMALAIVGLCLARLFVVIWRR
ncbi:hypothetical protein ACMU_07495 [Actibacterium mucosum KCTC 23349]|uniref:Uncharacterized protein n=1 Tax=Actibacterium mucosum KCTC 23349 TaxID=1454373 RepID=A0A037ZM97_9RHOB|nr:hypothetical protein [Actibacterium mucosum]KAJ56774.1 hypothetical protein ACMU_07495 [Actibacterium mucosum KCTC 23349]